MKNNIEKIRELTATLNQWRHGYLYDRTYSKQRIMPLFQRRP